MIRNKIKKCIGKLHFYREKCRCREISNVLFDYIKANYDKEISLPFYCNGIKIIWTPTETSKFNAAFTDERQVFFKRTYDVGKLKTPQPLLQKRELIKRIEQLPQDTNVDTMVIVPHGDDELFICGGVIHSRIVQNKNIIVVYANTTDYRGYEWASERNAESIKAMEILGVPQENLIQLGYSNSWRNGHIYHAAEDELKTSTIGKTETYGTDYIQDYHYLRYGVHAQYTRRSFKNDIVSVVSDYHPVEIIAVDYDTHADHRALHLICCEALKQISISEPSYKPIVYFGFSYSTSCYAKPDFSKYNPIIAVQKPGFFEKHVFTELPNPSYRWDERVSMENLDDFRNPNCIDNIGVKAFLCYERMIGSIESYINSDMVFWQRRMDNIAFHSRIIVSSGDGDYLNDGKRFDVQNIYGRPTKFDAGAWYPEKTDKKRLINVFFEKKSKVSEIRLYSNDFWKSSLNGIKIFLNGKKTKCRISNSLFSSCTLILIEPHEEVEWITIQHIPRYYGITEIEIFSEVTKKQSVHTIPKKRSLMKYQMM